MCKKLKSILYYNKEGNAIKMKIGAYTITVSFKKIKPSDAVKEEIKIEKVLTVKDCFTAYINGVRENLAAATIKSYENIRDKHLQSIMPMDIKKVNEVDIQRAFDDEISKGYSKKTLKGYWTLLNKVFAICRPDLKTNVILNYEPEFKWDTTNRRMPNENPETDKT